ncbi:AMP-binding protein [Rodentibacter caecimuris]|uniref:AMP-binding protein n=1 Tax=Rodentibacter caecimuris TaxID=1796644 RepID=A0ABX3KZL8_9PAST|nr:AMP-binding protein [Rodentibacter heylii]
MTEYSGDLNRLIAQNPCWTISDFAVRSQQISQQLQQDKLQAVALWLEDASEFACALFACLNAGVRVLLPPNVLEENQHWIAENANLFLTHSIFADYGRCQKISRIQPLFVKSCQTEIWLKTSGSSGEAKILRKTAEQMWTEAAAIAQILPFERGESVQVIGSVSVQHLYGLTFRIFVALEMGWLLGREQWQYPEYLIAESRRQRSLWISSPTLLSHLNLAHFELTECRLAGIISSGGALPEQIGNDIRQRLSCPLLEIYGSTETGAIAARENSDLWQPMPSTKLGLNERGALWVENSWIEGREQTADVVEFGEQGFHLLGRLDRIVKLGDKRVSLVKIEQALLRHPWVTDCYIGLHPKYSRPLAWLALTPNANKILSQKGRQVVIRELKDFLGKTQEKFALPRYWRFSEKLPRNSQSKIRRADFELICLAKE